MINYDLHIHTEFCGHAPGMTVEAIIDRADELGLETIAITDHIFGPDGLPIVTAIRAELSRLRPKCQVLLGAEVDVDWQHRDGRLVTDELDALDYVVAGFHYIPEVGNYPMTADDNTLTPELFLEVWRGGLLGIARNPKVHTMAHPGRLAAQSLDLAEHWDEVLIVLQEAAEACAVHGVAWEINELTGARLNGRFQKEWFKVYRIAVDSGVKLVYGSDAHSPSQIGRTTFAESILKDLPDVVLKTPQDLELV